MLQTESRKDAFSFPPLVLSIKDQWNLRFKLHRTVTEVVLPFSLIYRKRIFLICSSEMKEWK